ncbi:phosphatase PAP2 family protein [Nocardioides marmorisolisilvae]|uniref:Inositol phosphorylceramide synthase n=1 Tax=Nocardioides marmorisolisilvae TaxID=1542737 RepID=A0A3N0DZV3_9ACTN|nr:phosphatase PAP2 family protein [Nocardioides marmorisolisilvae]RNL81139.1 inositol phosphorylceramide synthase [Nocardioides marmorisolisilvae]
MTSTVVESPERVSRGYFGPAARLWALVLTFVAVGIARSAVVGVPFRDPRGEYFRGRLALTVGVFVLFVVADGVIRARRRSDLRSVLASIRRRWDARRLAAAAVALLAYDVTYHNLKSWDAFNKPRDAMLESWDRWIFGGHSPAVLLHHLLGVGSSAHAIMLWYSSFALLAILAFPAAVALARRTRDAYVGIASLCWVWILGTGTYYLIPSLGPFHEAPQDFASLPTMTAQRTQRTYLAERAQLLAHPGTHDAFAQVSAFASLHVGVTATIIGLAWWHRLRRTVIALSVYLVGTMIATVYLGWHFFVDLPAGLVIAGLAWILGPLTIGVRTRPTAKPGLL